MNPSSSWHIVAQGTVPGQHFTITAPGSRCGSWQENEICLPAGPAISPLQLIFRLEGEQLILLNLCSQGLVLLNEKAVPPGHETCLQQGDLITIGVIQFRLQKHDIRSLSQEASPDSVSDPFADLLVPGLVPIGAQNPLPQAHPLAPPTPPRGESNKQNHPSFTEQSWSPAPGSAPNSLSVLDHQGETVFGLANAAPSADVVRADHLPDFHRPVRRIG